jgi:hypothetical protein
MSIIKKIAITGVVLSAVVASGFLAPDHVVVTRVATTDATPQAVLQLAASNQGYQTFNPYKASDPALKITTFGPASGVGSGFAFDGKEGKGTTTITSHTADRVDYQIKLDGMGEPTQAIQTKVTPQGTQIEWSMTMEFGNNPALRLMGLMMPAMMGPTLEQGLSTLTKVASEA